MTPELVLLHVCLAHITLQSDDNCDWNSQPKQQNAQLMVDRAESAELRVTEQMQHP